MLLIKVYCRFNNFCFIAFSLILTLVLEGELPEDVPTDDVETRNTVDFSRNGRAEKGLQPVQEGSLRLINSFFKKYIVCVTSS